MARGFESKDVEFQQAEAAEPRAAARALTAEERERAGRRRTLELALARARSELAGTRSTVRQATLSEAVADLVRQLDATPAVGVR